MTNIKNEYELLKFMKDNVKYGFVTNDDKKYFPGNDNYNEIWFDKGMVQTGENVSKTLIGTCWDQVEFERKWFKDNNIKTKTFFLYYEIKEAYFKGLNYFVLLPLNDKTLKIQVPISNKLLRDVISKEKVTEIINNIPSIELIKTAYLRNKEREYSNKKISDKDKFYFEKAERLLYSEFSIVLNMTFDETKEYVANKVMSLV